MQLVREATLAGGRYRLLEARGVGGMATVWRAIDERLDRPVAVKVMSDVLAVDEDYVVRFHREARIAAGLSHPNLVRLFDFGADDGRPFLVSEWIDGPDLLELHREGASVDAERLLWNLLEALEHIHGEGIVHRDVKPSNILIDHLGEARLTDFGIAQPEDATRLTQTGLVMGTAPFIAPEVLAGEPSTRRSDLYAVGTVLRYMTGDVISPRLAAIVSQLTADDPGARPTSATAALEVAPDPYGSEPPEPPPPVPLRETRPPAPPSRRLPPDRGARSLLPFGIGLGAIALGAIVLALLASGSKPANDAAKPPPSHRGEQSSTPASTTAAQTTAPEAPPAPAAPAGAPPSKPKPKAKTDPAKGAELNSEGYALIGEGKYDEAVKKLEEAVSLFPPGTTDVNYAYALYNLGHALRLAGRPDEAIPVLEQRMQIPDQLPIVQRELDLARQQASAPPEEGGK